MNLELRRKSSLAELKSAAVQPGLHDLGQVVLDDSLGSILATAEKLNGGDAAWRMRKRKEARELLALSQISHGRIFVQHLELYDSLRAVVAMVVPVPMMVPPDESLAIGPYAVLGLSYPREALTQALPGADFVTILQPRHVWLPQVKLPEQPLCLGATIRPGTPVRSLLLMAYGALSMQAVQVNELDPAGVFNAEAAVWWQRNLDRAPLSREPFLREDQSPLPPFSLPTWRL